MKLLLRVVSFYILFGIIPIFGGAFLLHHAIDASEAAELIAAVASLRDELAGLRTRIDPKNFYSRWFEALTRDDVAAGNLDLTRNRIGRWGGPVDLFRFDVSAGLATMTWHRPEAPPAMRVIWQELRPAPGGAPERTRAEDATLDLLFGSDFTTGLLQAAGCQGVIVKSGQSDSLLFWKRIENEGGLICAVWQVPSGEELFRKLKRLHLRHGTTLLAARPGEPWRQSGVGCPGEAAIRAANRFHLYKDPWLESDGLVWVPDRIGETELLACRPNPAVSAARLRLAVNVVSVLLAVGALIFWYRWLVRGADIWVSVRVKLIFLFLFSTFLPLAGLAGLAVEAVSEREKVLTERALHQGKSLLESIDAGYEADRKRLRDVFRRIRDDRGLRSPDPALRQARIVALKKKHAMVKIEFRDRRGELVVSTDRPEMLARVENIFRVMAQIGLERHAPELMPPDMSGNVRQVDLFTRMAFENPALGLSSAMDQPGTVLNLEFAICRGLWFWDVIRDPSHPAAFVNIVKDRRAAVDYYLKQRFAARTKSTDGFRVFAYDIDGGTLTGREKVGIPSALRLLLDKSRISWTAATDAFFHRGVEHLAVCIPSVFLGRRQLLATIPREAALSNLGDFKTAVWLMFLIIAMSAVVSGKILADLFLKPIAELAAGMTALQAGDTSVRVRIESGDELGELGSAFNRMLEDMQEVRMAKMVQDALIPAGRLTIPGFDAVVILRRVSELSGDYVDAMKLADGRWLFVTGDVSGHGTSAALTMAMAKSITVQCADERGDPVCLLSQLDRILFRLLDRRQMMYCVAFTLDTKTGSIEIAGGGGPYPVIKRRNGALEVVRLVHFPLASSPCPAPFPRHVSVLEPGDILILCTDGLMKNYDVAGIPFGDERLEQAIRSAPMASAEAFSKSILTSYEGFVGSAQPDDDLSILVLQRNPRPSAEG
ncbi:SpoIIE family protein phosphatase [Candidatus Ozemobacteraceae bacterium]|nr:SpoIIE family protein phosphatase [Candidatus Ozemobacteraceae bacterium]